ncbi:MAG TPA: serine hydrolase [Bacillales bacterium]
MGKRLFAVMFSFILCGTLVFMGTGIGFASENRSQQPTIEQHVSKSMVPNSRRPSHSRFSWGSPGPSSPVLNPGSARSAGMVQRSLSKIDDAVQQGIANKIMPGAVVLVARRGRVVKHDAYGYAYLYADTSYTKVDNPIRMQEDTIFDLASLTKVFTATAIMQLYEEGKLDLDAPVAQYIPEFAQNGKSTVTVRQLLTHTSGFRPWLPLYQMANNREEAYQIVFSYSLKYEPGTHYVYSDLNFITLGALVERISGKRLDQYIEENITGPLHMDDTMFNPPERLKDRVAATEYQPWTGRGLVWGEVHDENAWLMDGVSGHAGLFSTAHDLAIFAQMILNDGKYKGARILEPETVAMIETNQLPDFPGDAHGLGWELAQGWYMDALAGPLTMGHTGFTGTSMVISPGNQAIAILLTNNVHPTREAPSTNPIRRKVARWTADAIPVAIPGKDNAWFSGYGSHVNRILTAKVDLADEAELSFDTWFRTENGYDLGYVEVSQDGAHWTEIGRYTGSSGDWMTETLALPAGTKYVRFRYDTDSIINGRGWYIHDISISQANGYQRILEFENDGWQKRDY